MSKIRWTLMAVTALCPLTSLEARANLTEGFNPRSTRCQFFAQTSVYGHALEGPQAAGSLNIIWSPVTEQVSMAHWYLRSTDREPYARLTASPRVAPRLFRDIALGPWVFSALVDSHPEGWSPLTGHRITGLLFPRYGADPEWHFAGIFEQTGSAYISATGRVYCLPPSP